MRVKIGDYVDYIGPYQIAEKILFWKDRDDDLVHRFGSWLNGDNNGKQSRLGRFCNYLNKKRGRKIDIKIHNYDTYSMDHTLSMIVVPMLENLKLKKKGSPHVDNKDVPSNYRLTKKEEDDNMDKFHERWNYILDEMIYAHRTIIDDSIDIDFDEEIRDRVNNGLRLFGKYYRNLWW